MLHAFMFTLNGIPVLYSGDEIGQENDNSYHMDSLKAEDSRYLHRGDFSWSNAEKRNEPGTVPNRLFSFIKQLEQIRADTAVFDSSAQVQCIDTGDDHVLAISRSLHDQHLLAFFNFSAHPETIQLPDDRFVDLLIYTQVASAVTLPSGSFTRLMKTDA